MWLNKKLQTLNKSHLKTEVSTILSEKKKDMERKTIAYKAKESLFSSKRGMIYRVVPTQERKVSK